MIWTIRGSRSSRFVAALLLSASSYDYVGGVLILRWDVGRRWSAGWSGCDWCGLLRLPPPRGERGEGRETTFLSSRLNSPLMTPPLPYRKKQWHGAFRTGSAKPKNAPTNSLATVRVLLLPGSSPKATAFLRAPWSEATTTESLCTSLVVSARTVSVRILPLYDSVVSVTDERCRGGQGRTRVSQGLCCRIWSQAVRCTCLTLPSVIDQGVDWNARTHSSPSTKSSSVTPVPSNGSSTLAVSTSSTSVPAPSRVVTSPTAPHCISHRANITGTLWWVSAVRSSTRLSLCGMGRRGRSR